MVATTPAPTSVQALQGIPVRGAVIDPPTFFRATNRQTFSQKGGAFAGLGNTDQFSLFQDGIVSALRLRVFGTVVVTLAAGTVATTRRWPYDLLKRVTFSANGQSQLVDCSGLKLKALEMMYPMLTDRGVDQGIGGAAPGTQLDQGTFAHASEDWGTSGANRLGSGVSAVVGAPTTYTVDLEYFIPVAFDQELLTGAILAQTQATDLVLALRWATLQELFTLTGAATVVPNLNYEVTGLVWAIPIIDGKQILPDLTQFHQVAESRSTSIANGDNEIPLPGVAAGRQLMRVFFQLWNGAASAPLAMNAANFGPQAWRYGGATEPERFPTGQSLRYENERVFDCDLGGVWGFGVHDFAAKFALRDSVDMSATTNLRLLSNVGAGVAIASPSFEFVQQVMLAAPVVA